VEECIGAYAVAKRHNTENPERRDKKKKFTCQCVFLKKAEGDSKSFFKIRYDAVMLRRNKKAVAMDGLY
jgi:hypothetical protein